MAAHATRIESRALAVVDEEACRGCGSCVAVCPEGVLGFSDTFNAAGSSFARVTAPERCLGEGHCLYVCPEGAIHLETSHVLRAV